MHKISIKNDTDNDIRSTYVSIDGQRIKAVSVNFNQSADTVPTCEIEIHALPDIEALADIQFRFSPSATEDALAILRHNMKADKEIYNDFLSGIANTLKEIPSETGLYDIAKSIADRIIGEE